MFYNLQGVQNPVRTILIINGSSGVPALHCVSDVMIIMHYYPEFKQSLTPTTAGSIPFVG